MKPEQQQQNAAALRVALISWFLKILALFLRFGQRPEIFLINREMLYLFDICTHCMCVFVHIHMHIHIGLVIDSVI